MAPSAAVRQRAGRRGRSRRPPWRRPARRGPRARSRLAQPPSSRALPRTGRYVEPDRARLLHRRDSPELFEPVGVAAGVGVLGPLRESSRAAATISRGSPRPRAVGRSARRTSPRAHRGHRRPPGRESPRGRERAARGGAGRRGANVPRSTTIVGRRPRGKRGRAATLEGTSRVANDPHFFLQSEVGDEPDGPGAGAGLCSGTSTASSGTPASAGWAPSGSRATRRPPRRSRSRCSSPHARASITKRSRASAARPTPPAQLYHRGIVRNLRPRRADLPAGGRLAIGSTASRSRRIAVRARCARPRHGAAPRGDARVAHGQKRRFAQEETLAMVLPLLSALAQRTRRGSSTAT